MCVDLSIVARDRGQPGGWDRETYREGSWGWIRVLLFVVWSWGCGQLTEAGHGDHRLNGAPRIPRQSAEWRVSDPEQVPCRRQWGTERRGRDSPGEGWE